MQVRNVRLLDRLPGEPTEWREVDGVKIEKNVPIPRKYHGRLVKALRTMEVGESFWHAKRITTSEQKRSLPGRKFITRRDGNGYRCWRVA